MTDERQNVGDTREEVWLRAFCAYVASFNARTESGIRAADECLRAFDERFPRPRITQ